MKQNKYDAVNQRKIRKRKRFSDDFKVVPQQDGRTPCESITDEDFDEFQERLDETI